MADGKISRAEVEKLAQLARLELDEGQTALLVRDLDQILDYVAQLKAVEAVGDLEAQLPSEAVNVLREDELPEAVSGAAVEELIKAAPKNDGKFIRVKKIL